MDYTQAMGVCLGYGLFVLPHYRKVAGERFPYVCVQGTPRVVAAVAAIFRAQRRLRPFALLRCVLCTVLALVKCCATVV